MSAKRLPSVAVGDCLVFEEKRNSAAAVELLKSLVEQIGPSFAHGLKCPIHASEHESSRALPGVQTSTRV